MTLTASVVGASGFAGGELLRLLSAHPEFEVVQATSREYENRTVGHVHPNLRELDLRFSDPEGLESVDALFAATPHGVSMANVESYLGAAERLIDLSADFRLGTEAAYDEWYDGHTAPEYLDGATYALPELGREGLADADIVASGGCNATATMLALKPLVDADLLQPDDQVVADLKVGSSEGGAGGGAASSHPERSGVVRPYAPTGHRHEAEIEEQLGLSLSFTVHAVDMVRGAAATCHTFPTGPSVEGGVETADLWSAYRDAYEGEPFVRLVAGGGGVYRYPEPKSVAGTNLAEVGFAADGERVVAFAAIDNVMKGAAGQAVHAANLAFGLEETAGLTQTGFHPVGSP
ncbi:MULTISPECIES: N-acetyl-gamma-glutamyl-phosphate reductase [Halolamina]|uniref:N-acetyl-gamma-glutamyl-phosphate reductase n=1 Tax=Halolamina pelagica TaxID=699431 RepID=A0A1I5P3X5_9EURY|nr:MULTISPECIES: N-acetyl-gamma-glutamyl-phosphate reductase [Halolamina]NHX36611.1 N-acetyl-gamma-glutamyl-phosphate reductase [Halolamina sp. R1-12]SFP28663.1 N-acetyl-gamma-glutamyl-phosphate reductase [Halolamina pelagica]